MNQRVEAVTILSAPWLNLARALWLVLVGAIVVISLGFLPVRFVQYPVLCGQDETALQTVSLVTLCVYSRMAISTLLFVASLVVCGIVFWRRSDDWLVMLASLMAIFTAALFAFMSALVPVPHAWYLPTMFIRVAAPLLIFIFFYVFPDGRIMPRAAVVPMMVSIAFTLSWIVFPASPINIYNLSTWPLSLSLFLLCFLVGVLVQLYRYFRISNPTQRQQTKWVVIGTFATFPAFLIVYLPIGVMPDLQNPGLPRLLYTLLAEPFFQLTYLFALVCVVIAVLRYRLWDIQVLIRRTITYATLGIVLTIVYFGCVISLQQVFASVTRQRSEIITVLSTLTIAALFIPLRNRIQDAMDRHFNREKYNAQQVLQKFGETVRDETDLEKLASELIHVVQETMQPRSVSLWLKPDSDRKRIP